MKASNSIANNNKNVITTSNNGNSNGFIPSVMTFPMDKGKRERTDSLKQILPPPPPRRIKKKEKKSPVPILTAPQVIQKIPMDVLQSSPSSSREKSNPRRWSKAEDESLRLAVERSGERNWKAIADQVPGRNHTQCLQRWTKVLKPGLIKGHWTAEEDLKLRSLVAEGRKNWGQVASHIPGRTSKQCRERWCNHLDPNINKGSYTKEEDNIILEMQSKLGNRWSIIAQQLSGRTEDAVKIRWKSLMRSKRARHKDEKLNDSVVSDKNNLTKYKTNANSTMNKANVMTKQKPTETALVENNTEDHIIKSNQMKKEHNNNNATQSITSKVLGTTTLTAPSGKAQHKVRPQILQPNIMTTTTSAAASTTTASASASATSSSSIVNSSNSSMPPPFSQPAPQQTTTTIKPNNFNNFKSNSAFQYKPPSLFNNTNNNSNSGMPPPPPRTNNFRFELLKALESTTAGGFHFINNNRTNPIPSTGAMSSNHTILPHRIPYYPLNGANYSTFPNTSKIPLHPQHPHHPPIVPFSSNGDHHQPIQTSLYQQQQQQGQHYNSSISSFQHTIPSSGRPSFIPANSTPRSLLHTIHEFNPPNSSSSNSSKLATPREEWGTSHTPRSQLILNEEQTSEMDVFNQQRLRLMLKEDSEKYGQTVSPASSPGQAMLTKELELNNKRQIRQAKMLQHGWKHAVDAITHSSLDLVKPPSEYEERFDGLLEKVNLASLDPTDEEYVEKSLQLTSSE